MLGGLFNNSNAKEGPAPCLDRKTLSPRMKVFTVGLDQKPPLKNDSEKAEKSSSPPPGYSATTTQHLPLPVGPEIPLPPTPLIMRKSRGYKGVLLVMLSVFLIALFALTLSEIAYNHQRDESFFRLRWAELNHRLRGYADYDYYFNRSPYTYSRQKELGQPIVPISFSQPLAQHQAEEPKTTSTPVLAEVIDTSKTVSRHPLGTDLSLSHSNPFSSQQASAEQQHASKSNDTPLQFLRSVIRRIQQHMEEIGFDGMMQVSVIEVEPQGEESNGAKKLNAPSPAIQRGLPELFSHLISAQSQQQPQQQQQSPHVDEPPMLNIKTNAFLDGFGEIHQPSLLQNNQIAEQNRARFENNNNNNNQRNNNEEQPIEFEEPIRVNNAIGAEDILRHSNWHLMQQLQQQPPQLQHQQQQAFPLPFPQILTRPLEWSNNGVTDDDIMARRFGQQSQEPAQALQHHQMISAFPRPLFFSSPVSQQSQQLQAQPSFSQFPTGQMLGVGDSDMEFRPFKAPISSFFEFSGRPQTLEYPPLPQPSGVESGQEMGDMQKKLKEIISNRLHTQFQQQSQQAGQLQQPNPMTFVPPENRIQIEPLTPVTQTKTAASDNADRASKTTIVDSDDIDDNNHEKNNNNAKNQNDKVDVGWTHQPQFRGPIVPAPVGDDATSDDSLESVRNFAKMMAAGVAEEATRRRAEAITASLTSSSSAAEPAAVSKNVEHPLPSFFFGPRSFVAKPIIVNSFLASTSAPVVDNEEDHRPQSNNSAAGPKTIMPVLSIDSPNVDFPAVRFPMSKEKDSEKHVGVVMDRVSNASPDNQNDDADAQNKSAGSTTKSNADNDNNEQKNKNKPQINEPMSAPVVAAANANGVFFQVDDPTAAEVRHIIPA